MRLSIVSSVLIGAAYGKLVNRQTASELLTALNQISTTIPGTCTAACQPFLADFRACPSLSPANIGTCACAPAFLADVATCTACFTTEGDATGAELAATVNGACGQAGVVVSSSTSLPVAAVPPVTSAASVGPAVNPNTVTLNTASPSSQTITAVTSTAPVPSNMLPTVVTATLTEGGYGPFPIQTKSANVFTGGAPKTIAAVWNSLYALSAAAIAVIVFA